MDAVERRLRDSAEQASDECANGRLFHLLVTFAEGNEHDARGGAEAREVPRAHRALNEVVAKGVDVHQHDGVQWPV